MIGDEIRSAYHHAKWGVALRGLFAITVGILILLRPLESVAALALVIALWSFMDGLVNIVRSFQVRPFVQHWWVMLLGGIVSVGFGIAAIYYYPVLSLSFAVLWTAYWLILSGVVAMYASVMERRAQMTWGWSMAFGAIAVASGILALMYPGVTLAWLMGVLAGFGIIGGAALVAASVKMQSVASEVDRAFRQPTRA